jgi:hypothetical protein
VVSFGGVPQNDLAIGAAGCANSVQQPYLPGNDSYFIASLANGGTLSENGNTWVFAEPMTTTNIGTGPSNAIGYACLGGQMVLVPAGSGTTHYWTVVK